MTNAARQIEVFVVLPPRTLLLDVAGPLEVLRRANMIQQAMHFEVRYVAPTRTVETSIGLAVGGVQALPRTLPANAMIIVAGNVDLTITGCKAGSSIDLAHEAAIVDWLRNTIRPGHRLICICSGSLFAARAGLLDGYDCTTHFSCCTQLAALAPTARVIENRLYVEDGERWSSAGVTAGIDLMLDLVSRDTDHACAQEIARYLVVYLRRSGADPQLSPWLEGRNHIHPAVHRVQDAIARDPTQAWPASRLAQIAAASPRHLSRLFAEHTGMSIADYRNRLRVALANELLGNTRLDMEHIAERAGFASTRQLRRVWHKLQATSPRQARRERAISSNQ